MCCTAERVNDRIYVAEAGAPAVQAGVPNLGQRVVILDTDLNEVDSFGAGLAGEGHDQFIASHGIATDSSGAVYVAEVSYTNTGSNLRSGREKLPVCGSGSQFRILLDFMFASTL